MVVPDLEGITRQHLRSLDGAAGDPAAVADHEWMIVELLDQMVRTRPGGSMRRLLDDEHLPNRAFVYARIGCEMTGNGASTTRPSFTARVKHTLTTLRRGAAVAAAAVVFGREGYRDLEEVLFRRSGEVHRWMYDRVALTRVLTSHGFEAVAQCSAIDSRLPGFAGFELDASGGRVHKPDSLFIEGVKPVR